MKWKTKAKIQNAISLLNRNLSYTIYYWIQRRFGSLKNENPISSIIASIETCNRINAQGKTPTNKTFLEIGTGWRLNTPITMYLLGANKIITVDSNPYLKYELIKEDIEYIRNNKQKIIKIFSSSDYFLEKRLNQLLAFDFQKFKLYDFLDLSNIEYLNLYDCSNLNIQAETIDYYISHLVFEHIPFFLLEKILLEGNRIIKRGGLFIHLIDFSDHFSLADKSISSINFLQYSDSQWEKYAGNIYAYVNRLRIDDFENLFKQCNQKILSIEPTVDSEALNVLNNSNSFKLNKRFESKHKSSLCTTKAYFVIEKNENK